MAIPVPTFGELLRRHRLSAGLTHAELAARAGLSVRAISDLERGINRKPRKDTLNLLVTALELSPQEQDALAAAIQRRAAGETRAAGEGTGHHLRVAAPAFVGRTRELAVIERYLATGGPPLLAVAGEPGIGKSRLLQEVAERARARGWCVLAGGCHRRSGQEPFAPVLEALHRDIEAQPSMRRQMSLRGCAWLVRMLPELTPDCGPLPAWTVPPPQERRLMFGAVARYVANVAGPAGTLLTLDDLQWAGQDALDLLAALVRSSSLASLRVLGAYRDTEVATHSSLAVLLTDLARDGLAEKLEVGPLADDEAAELIAGLLARSDDDASGVRQQVLERAGGVPFFLVSCAQALRGDPPDTENGTQDPLPWTVAQSIRQRMASLPDDAQRLLEVAAVVGRRISRALLFALTASTRGDDGAVLEALDAACSARLLIEDGADAYQFAHDLIREAVTAHLSTARRVALHRRVAETLERMPAGAPVEVLAYHYQHAGEPERAVIYLERAGDRAAAMHANAEASQYYAELVDRLDALGRCEQAAQARTRLAGVLITSARYDQALEALEQALAVYQARRELVAVAQAAAQLGWAHALRGTMQAGIDFLNTLLGDLNREGAIEGLADVYVALAQLYFASGQYAKLQEASEHAIALARAAGDEHALAIAKGRQAIALCQLGRTDEGVPVLHEACRLIEATGDQWNLCSSLNNLAVVYDDEGMFAESLKWVERALEVAERMGVIEQIASMTYRRGQEAFFVGNWTQARADYTRAIALNREVGEYWASSYPPAKLARLALAEGKLDEAMCLSEQAIALAQRRGNTLALRYAQSTLAEHDLLQGQHEAALARLMPFLDQPGEQTRAGTELLPLVAWAYLVSGAAARCERIIGQCMARAAREHQRLVVVDALRVRAMLEIQRRRYQESQDALEETLTHCRAMPYPYAEAKALYVYGRLYTARGEPEPAHERLAAAQAICDRLGENLYRRNIEQALNEI